MNWPVEVVSVELEGPVFILPPHPTQAGDGYLRIPVFEAYTRFDRNGRGYFDQMVATGYTWDFSVPEGGPAEIQVEVLRPEKETAIEIVFNGSKSIHTVNPADSERDLVLVSPGSFNLDPGKACRLTIQAPGYEPGKPVGVSPAGMRIRNNQISDD